MSSQFINKKKARELYVRFSLLREDTLKIQEIIQKVESISVNASVVASQTGNQIRIFTELAVQIKKNISKDASGNY